MSSVRSEFMAECAEDDVLFSTFFCPATLSRINLAFHAFAPAIAGLKVSVVPRRTVSRLHVPSFTSPLSEKVLQSRQHPHQCVRFASPACLSDLHGETEYSSGTSAHLWLAIGGYHDLLCRGNSSDGGCGCKVYRSHKGTVPTLYLYSILFNMPPWSPLQKFSRVA